jgi:hypothetical protein
MGQTYGELEPNGQRHCLSGLVGKQMAYPELTKEQRARLGVRKHLARIIRRSQAVIPCENHLGVRWCGEDV